MTGKDRENSIQTVKDVEARTGISGHTIRYYDKCGFFPSLERSKGRIRHFSEQDIKRLEFIESLRRSGLSIEGIRYIVSIESSSTKRSELSRIIETQINMLEIQREQIDASIAHLDKYVRDLGKNE